MKSSDFFRPRGELFKQYTEALSSFFMFEITQFKIIKLENECYVTNILSVIRIVLYIKAMDKIYVL